MAYERTYDEYDNEGKVSQRSVNLRWAQPKELEQCSLCENWLGGMRTKGGSLTTGACALVEGQIKTHEICDLYEKGPNFYERIYGSRYKESPWYAEEVFQKLMKKDDR